MEVQRAAVKNTCQKMVESELSRRHSNSEKRSGDHSAVLKTELGLGEMVQLIMCLLHIDMELSLIP